MNDNVGFPGDEESYYDDDFQTNEKNNTSSISSPKKTSGPQQQTNLQRSRDNRYQNHVPQAQYAYTAKEKPPKKSTASQSQISTYVRSNKNEAENKPQTSHKSQYNYFGSGFTLRSKSNVHSKVEISTKKRKRSKFLDDFWNSDEEDVEEVCANNSSYNSDSDNSSYNKQRKSPSEKIQSFKSKYFQHKSHEQISDDEKKNKIDKNEVQQHEELEEIYRQRHHVEAEENEDNTSAQHEQQYYDENYQEEHLQNSTRISDEAQNNSRYADEDQNQHNYEEIPYDEEQAQPHQDEEYNEEYFEENKEDANTNATNEPQKSNEIDANIAEEGPSLFIPTILVDSETPDPIIVSDSDSSQLIAPNTNSSLHSNNPIIIDSSPIRNESTDTKNNNDIQSKKTSKANNTNAKNDSLADENAYFEKIRNATANKRRKIILD
jgi:hypothetical protein